jgi:hypothetical protein
MILHSFRTHNSVNVRLKKEQAEREGKLVTAEDEMKAQWPSRTDCPICWEKDGAWDEDVMYKYLRMEYWPEDADSIEFRQQLSLALSGQTKAQGDNEDEEEDKVPSMLPLILGLVLITAILANCAKKLNRDSTGRHKKCDEFDQNWPYRSYK